MHPLIAFGHFAQRQDAGEIGQVCGLSVGTGDTVDLTVACCTALALVSGCWSDETRPEDLDELAIAGAARYRMGEISNQQFENALNDVLRLVQEFGQAAEEQSKWN